MAVLEVGSMGCFPERLLCSQSIRGGAGQGHLGPTELECRSSSPIREEEERKEEGAGGPVGDPTRDALAVC